MTITQATYICAEPGAIRPVECEPWCVEADGHPRETGREDQACWGPEHYIEASTEEVLADYDKSVDSVTIYPARIGAMAYRGFNRHAQVYVHVELPGHANGVDVSVKLTPREARQLAAHLVEAAELIGAARAGQLVGTSSP